MDQSAAETPSGMSMGDAISSARREMAAISALPIDSIVRCEQQPDGGWTVVLEMLESAARMGDNDYLSAYEMRFASGGGLTGLTRLARYYREDGTVA